MLNIDLLNKNGNDDAKLYKQIKAWYLVLSSFVFSIKSEINEIPILEGGGLTKEGFLINVFEVGS